MNGTVSVCYKGFYSESWKTKSGLRQGGILSAYLFSFYIDEVLEKISRLGTGCFLGINKINILAYADDLVLLSPTSSGLQVLLNKIESFLDRLKLNVNVDKTVSMIFNRKKNLSDISFLFNGRVLSKVLKYKYLGCILSTDLTDEEDIERSFKSFNKSFGCILRKFNSVDTEILYSLFNTYCVLFYGVEMCNRFYSTKYYRKINVSYHASLKNILKVPRFYSNHFVCCVLNAFTFENLLNFRQLRFLFWLRKCENPCFYLHKTYFLYNSTFAHRIFKVWQEKYSVCNI